MMDVNAKQKRNEYHRNYYKENPSPAKNAQYRYWEKKAKEYLNKDVVTDEEIRQIKNQYYSSYRKNNPNIIKKNQDDFWIRKAKEATENESKDEQQNDGSL